MKNQGIKLAVIALTILSVSGCGKKGGGGGTAKGPSSTAVCSGGLCTSGGNLGNIGRRVWSGQLRVSDMNGFRQFMLDSGGCSNPNDCQGLQSNLELAVGLVDGYVPGTGSFQLKTFRMAGGYNRNGICNLNANNIPVAASSNNGGILFNYNLNYTMNSCGGGGGNGPRYNQYARGYPSNGNGTLQIVVELRNGTSNQYNNYSQYSQVPTSIYYRGMRIATGALVDYNYGNIIINGGRNNDFIYVNGGDDYFYNSYDDYKGYRYKYNDVNEIENDDLKYFALKILDKFLDRKFFVNDKVIVEDNNDGNYERN